MKLVHTSDLHLGYRAYNKVNQAGLNIREADVYKSCQDLIDKIIDINPDILLVAGDIFHHVRPSNTAIRIAIQLFGKLREKTSSTIVMIGGNHESPKTTESGSILQVFSDIFDKFYVFDSQIGELPVNNLCKITCIPHNAMEKQAEYMLKPDKNFQYNILMLHGTANEEYVNDFGGHDIVNKRELFNDPWNYIALGHYHNFMKIKPHICYSGAIDFTSCNIWQEDQPKSFIEYDLATQTLTRHHLKQQRKVVDLGPIWAENLTKEELNGRMVRLVESVKGGIDDKIVRLKIFNVPPLVYNSIDFDCIRKWRNKALHFKPYITRLQDYLINTDKETLYHLHTSPIDTQLDGFIDLLELDNTVDKKYLKNLGQEYYAKVTDKR